MTLVPALLLAALWGCSKDEPAAKKAGGAPPPHDSSGPLTVQLYPEAPTALDSLQAFIGGEGKSGIVLQWRLNGEDLGSGYGTTLPAGMFHKGDQVLAVATAGEERSEASVLVANAPPKVIRVDFRSPYLNAGRDIEVIPEGLDPDGDDISFRYLWSINGEELSWLDQALLEKGRFSKGDEIRVDVTAFDGESFGETFPGQSFVVPNAPPGIVSAPVTQFTSQTYLYQVVAEDPDGEDVTFSLESAPAGMTIDAVTGKIEWAIGSSQSGDHLLRIIATDADGMRAVQEFMLTISIP